MNKLKTSERAAITRCLVEGNSIRATCRITGAAKNTVTKLLCDLGHACHAYQDRVLRGLACERIQVDEIWSFVYGKDKNITDEQKAEGYGSVWTWTAIDADTKLVPSWLVGGRDAGCAHQFVTEDLVFGVAARGWRKPFP